MTFRCPKEVVISTWASWRGQSIGACAGGVSVGLPALWQDTIIFMEKLLLFHCALCTIQVFSVRARVSYRRDFGSSEFVKCQCPNAGIIPGSTCCYIDVVWHYGHWQVLSKIMQYSTTLWLGDYHSCYFDSLMCANSRTYHVGRSKPRYYPTQCMYLLELGVGVVPE